MKLVRNLNELPTELRGGAVSIGNFDGVHQGHARIVETLRTRAAAFDGPSIVFTFDPHPVRLLRPNEVPPPLTWSDRKAELIEELGVDGMVVYPTDEKLLALTPEEFFREIVVQRLGARAMVEGPNFYFGKDRAGDINVLRTLCDSNDVALEVVQPLTAGTDYVSSSRIRRLIEAGDVGQAAEMLTRPYRIRGMVTHGAGRGAKLGFPTANIDAIDTILPGIGVYAGRAFFNNQQWPTAVNIGPNPTFGEDRWKVEAHLIGFSGSLYGQPLEVDFLAHVRETRRFASVEELQQQLASDVREVERRTSNIEH
ncbi:MAG: bifunctional riboflavin kinase/FAD synthetase [Planctomycetaceae bacterium]|nr:bifunctional riboflavin kinase/FAD synthetase [Planctomycetaceae bacterium]MCB9937776.1 bifunctional riboflavin kinase/FAD synthetase [Planctomycetaceae bacterium]